VIALAGAFDAARRGPLANALASSPDARTFLDPFEYLTGAVDTRFVVIHGGDDPIISTEVATDFADRAAAVGFDVDVHLLPDGQHVEFGSPSTVEGAAALNIFATLLSD
jgi:acetyl esterase/lipase